MDVRKHRSENGVPPATRKEPVVPSKKLGGSAESHVHRFVESVHAIGQTVDPGADDRFQAHDYERIQNQRRKRAGTMDAASFNCEASLPASSANSYALEAFHQAHKPSVQHTAQEVCNSLFAQRPKVIRKDTGNL
jgi:hypothetical protein